MPSPTNKTKLSNAQATMLARLKVAGTKGERTPFVGGREAGRVACAWYRTAAALAAKGLVTVVREGDAQRAFLKDPV